MAALGVWAPLDVEADGGGGREGAGEIFGFEDPGFDMGRGGGEKGLDGDGGIDGDGVGVVGVVREVVVDDGDVEGGWKWCGIGDDATRADVSAGMVYYGNRHSEG